MVVIVLSECWEEDNTKNSSICKKVADNRNRGIEPIVRKFHFDYFLSICKVVFFCTRSLTKVARISLLSRCLFRTRQQQGPYACMADSRVGVICSFKYNVEEEKQSPRASMR